MSPKTRGILTQWIEQQVRWIWQRRLEPSPRPSDVRAFLNRAPGILGLIEEMKPVLDDVDFDLDAEPTPPFYAGAGTTYRGVLDGVRHDTAREQSADTLRKEIRERQTALKKLAGSAH